MRAARFMRHCIDEWSYVAVLFYWKRVLFSVEYTLLCVATVYVQSIHYHCKLILRS